MKSLAKQVGAAALVAAVAMVLLGSAPPAGAEVASTDDPHLPLGASLLTEEEAWATDAEAIAASTGSPAGAIRRRLALQVEANRFIESIPAGILARSFAGKVSDSPGTGAVLYFKGEVPAGVPTPAPAGITLQGGMPYSLTELSARQDAMHQALVGLGFTQILSNIDIRTQHITVDVVRQASKPALSGRALRSAMTAALPDLRSDEVTLVEHTPGQTMVELEHGYGGAYLLRGETRWCTSGFSARRLSDGIGHFLTAAHCERINAMEESNASGGRVTTFAAPWRGEHIGTNGDIELHATTGHDDYPRFWSATSTLRTVTSRIPSSGYGENDLACHYGRFGGYSCGEISRVVTDSTFVWEECGNGGADCVVTAHNMVAVAGATSTGGDSGGPWFIGGEAYGIHHGSNSTTGERYFSRIQRAESQFGVTVLCGSTCSS